MAFGRPHTLVGTTASVVAVFAIAADAAGAVAGLSPGSAAGQASAAIFTQGGLVLATALLAALAANFYIVGLNQITDVPIDRINKPHLPIPSGALSTTEARWIVATSGGLALLAAAIGGPILAATVGSAMVIGTVYSVRPLRLKRDPILAALSIAFVRGVVVNAGVYLYAADALGAPVDLPIRIRLLISFVFAFTLAIAIAKDLPDTEGDRQHAIPTFALRFGRIPALRTATALFAAAIICLIVAGVIGVPDMDGRLLAAGNAPIVILLVARARRVERAVDDPAAVAGFYRLVWAAFTAEYVIFSVACLIR